MSTPDTILCASIEGAARRLAIDATVTEADAMAELRRPGRTDLLSRGCRVGLGSSSEGRVRWGLFRTPVARHAYGHPASRLLLPPVRLATSGVPATPVDGTEEFSHATQG